MSLRLATIVFVASWLAHLADHIRTATEATTPGTLMGVLATIFVILPTVAVTLVFAGHPVAPTVGAIVFPIVAIGVVVSHLLPEGIGLGEPVYADVLSVAAAGFETTAAALAGYASFRSMRSRRLPARSGLPA